MENVFVLCEEDPINLGCGFTKRILGVYSTIEIAEKKKQELLDKYAKYKVSVNYVDYGHFYCLKIIRYNVDNNVE